MWGDSDIPYLQQMTTPERIATAMLLGLYFAKIGAKITENSKPLDMGQMFKILRLSKRQMTSIHKEKPLSVMVDLIFKQLRENKELLLSTLKEEALKDLLVTVPETMAKAFSATNVLESFVASGMLDNVHRRCPDLVKIIKTFKVRWHEVPGGKI